MRRRVGEEEKEEKGKLKEERGKLKEEYIRRRDVLGEEREGVRGDDEEELNENLQDEDKQQEEERQEMQ